MVRHEMACELAIFVFITTIQRMRIWYIIAFLLVSLGALAQQPSGSRSELEKRRQNILEAIRETQEQLVITKKDKNATIGQLRALQNKLAERQKLINNINQEVAAINQNIQYSAKEIAQLRQNLDMLKIRYAQSIRYAYKNRSSYNMLAFLFSSDDFNEAIRRLKYLKKYRDYRKEQADQIRITHSSIEKKLGILNKEKSQKDLLRTAEEQQKMVILKETTEKDKVVKELKGREKELAGSISKNQKSLRQLEKTISNLIQREIELAKKREEEERRREEQQRKEEEQRRLAAANAGNNMTVNTGSGTRPAVPGGTTPTSNPTATRPSAPAATKPVASTVSPKPTASSVRPSYKLSLTPEATAISNNFEGNKGKLPWPVQSGFIAEGFGKKKHPVYNIVMDNTGIEIQTNPNAPARAVFNGKVSSIVFVPGMGQCVLVTHGQFFTVYSRLGNLTVKKGDNVSLKQTLGYVIPNDNGENLMHFELWKVGSNDKSFPLDPAGWIAQ